MLIKVGVMPGRINEYVLDEGATVREALEVAELTTEGYQIKVNGEPAEEALELKENDLVLLTKQIKGN